MPVEKRTPIQKVMDMSSKKSKTNFKKFARNVQILYVDGKEPEFNLNEKTQINYDGNDKAKSRYTIVILQNIPSFRKYINDKLISREFGRYKLDNSSAIEYILNLMTVFSLSSRLLFIAAEDLENSAVRDGYMTTACCKKYNERKDICIIGIDSVEKGGTFLMNMKKLEEYEPFQKVDVVEFISVSQFSGHIMKTKRFERLF